MTYANLDRVFVRKNTFFAMILHFRKLDNIRELSQWADLFQEMRLGSTPESESFMAVKT